MPWIIKKLEPEKTALFLLLLLFRSRRIYWRRKWISRRNTKKLSMIIRSRRLRRCWSWWRWCILREVPLIIIFLIRSLFYSALPESIRDGARSRPPKLQNFQIVDKLARRDSMSRPYPKIEICRGNINEYYLLPMNTSADVDDCW